MKQLISFVWLCFPICFFSQQYRDYVGAGHSNGITVTSSNQQTRTGWNENASAKNTINGNGLDARLLETSRFLAQTTFGTDLNYIKAVAENPFEDWIDTQFDINSPSLGQLTQNVFDIALARFITNGGSQEDYNGPSWRHFQYAWWESNIDNEDLLRQRIALALSEIIVISRDSSIGSYGIGLADFYDVLKDNAFGNFRDLLLEITLHPMMGGYLSHYNNPKSDPDKNIHPDENFAREIMQLFSIGLYELNQNGTYILDSEGNKIPTYGIDDIKEFAKIFTGLGPADVVENEWVDSPRFGISFGVAKKDIPMIMYDDQHEQGEKHLLNGEILVSGQSGMQDIEDAVDNLFNHQNVAPFISLRLIQQLVKSNPSPGYISRVSTAFNNTKGVRGDMKAVIKAILLDDEARSCSWSEDSSSGKLIEPMLRYFNVTRQIDLDHQSQYNWNIAYDFYSATGQSPLAAPSVFNFYLPEYIPNQEFTDANLYGPEFEIHNSATSINFVNQVDLWTNAHYYSVLKTWEDTIEGTPLDFEALKYYAKESEVLVNQLDKLFTRGQLSNETKSIIIDAVEPIVNSSGDREYTDLRVKMALYLMLLSPDYAILK